MTAAADAEAKLAAIATQPDYSVELSYGVRGSAYTDMVSLMFRMDLPVFAGTRQDPAALARAKQAEQARAQAEEARRRYEAEVRAALADYEIALARVERNEKEIVPIAEERAKATLAAYEGGRADLNAVLEARRMLLEVAPHGPQRPCRGRPRLGGPRLPDRRKEAAMNRTLVSAAVGAALLAAGGYGGYWYAQRAMHAAPAAGAAGGQGRRAAARSSTGTTRCTRPRSSTSPAARPSWTWTSCPSTPTTAPTRAASR